MRSKMLGIGVALVVCVLVLATSAQANTVTSLTVFDGVTNNFATDASGEYVWDRDGDNVLSTGDIVFGQAKFVQLNGTTLTSDWTAFFWTEVLDITATPGGGNQISFGPDATASNPWVGGSYTPGLYPMLDGSVPTIGGGTAAEQATNLIADLNLPGTFIGSADASKTMIMFFEDKADTNTFSLTDGPGQSTDEVSATNGNFFWAVGMDLSVLAKAGDGDATNDVSVLDERWVTNKFTGVSLPGPGVDIGEALFSLNQYGKGNGGVADTWVLGPKINLRYPGLTYGLAPQVIPTDFTGKVTFKVPDAGTPIGWPVANNITDFNYIAVRIVPLPAAAWMGIALLGAMGVGYRLRRRR